MSFTDTIKQIIDDLESNALVVDETNQSRGVEAMGSAYYFAFDNEGSTSLTVRSRRGDAASETISCSDVEPAVWIQLEKAFTDNFNRVREKRAASIVTTAKKKQAVTIV